MSDPRDEIPASESTPHDPASTSPTGPVSSTDAAASGAIPPPLGAAIAAAVPIIGSVVMLVLERKNAFVRFYAMQSLVFGLAWIVLGIGLTIANVILGLIPLIGWLLALVLGIASSLLFLAFLVVWAFQIYKALTGVEWEIPYLGQIARNLQTGKPPFEEK